MESVPHPATEYDDEQPLIPQGKYTMTYVKHHYQKMFGRGSLMVTFKVIDFGEHFEKKLVRYYNCHKTSQRKIVTRPKSDLQREFTAVTGICRKRGGIIQISAMKDIPVLAKVATVTKDKRQTELHEFCHYSKVAYLIGKAEI